MVARLVRLFLFAAALALPAAALPQAQAQLPAQGGTLPSVTVKGTKDPNVEKSYRAMVRGMDLFEQKKGRMAPGAQLRFRVLPRKPGVNLDNLEMYVFGDRAQIPVDLAPDKSFVLPRNEQALRENAIVTPDRRALTMTWRADVRTPGLPPDTRRLGDLRLECQVGMEAGLVSNSPSWIVRLYDALDNTPEYCTRRENKYLFFADKPVFGVTLVAGNRREVLPTSRLWASALDDPHLREDLPYCDCERLVDRTYYVPLGDPSWPDDTLVVFDFMEDTNAAAR